MKYFWGGRWGSNPQPLGPQPSAPPLSYDHHVKLVSPLILEPDSSFGNS